jgi:hypothetical protein
MKLGIKVGPQHQSILDLEETNSPFAEVWFRIDKKDDYNEIFSFLKKKQIDTGLHFWGLTHDGVVPTLTHDDLSLLQESMSLMKQTIDIASHNNFSYVNIHPGFRMRIGCEYTDLIFSQKDDRIVPFKQATIHFLDSVEQLTAYAKRKNVVLTVETTPIRLQIGSLHKKENRLSVQNFSEYSYIELPTDMLHFAIANDFCHTAANSISEDAKPIWDFLYKKTIEYAPKTRLLHLGFIVPPYNGTDYHDQLDNPMFETPDAVPNKSQMVDLLRLFQKRDDVWALVEPNGQHPKNYFLAQKLLSEAVH